MKNIFTNEKINSIIARAQHLQPTAQPLWGQLSVNGMLYHCTLINNQIFNSKKTRKPKLKERFLKPVLRVMKALPKGIKTGNALLAPQLDALQFDKELAAFITSVNQYKDDSPAALMGLHPLFGPLNTNEWRKFLWLHLDHHLNQFGV